MLTIERVPIGLEVEMDGMDEIPEGDGPKKIRMKETINCEVNSSILLVTRKI